MIAELLVGLTLAAPGVDGHGNMNAGNGDYRKACSRACRRRERYYRRRVRAVRPYSAKLDRMAHCESGGRWHISTGNGFYGGLQFTLSTWNSVGGSGFPHWASKLEQKYRAVLLIRSAGYSPWPVCGSA